MKRLWIIGLLVGLIGSAWGISYDSLPPANSAAGPGIRYSPKHFTATIFSPITYEAMPSNKIILSGGNVANYTTAECSRVVVFRNNQPALVCDPTMYRFNYKAPTLEVVGINFNPTDSFRVEFIDTSVGTKKNMANLLLTTAETIYPLILTAEAGPIISYDMIARNGDIKWLESNSSTAEYITIKQDISDYPILPVFIAKNEVWYFKSSTNNVTLEVQTWE